MKKSAQNRIIIWSIVSVVLIAILVAGFVVNANGRYVPSINDRLYGTNYDTYTDTIYNKATGLGYSIDELSYIDINLSNGKVIFEENESDTIDIVQLKSSSSDEIDNENEFYYQYDGTSLWFYSNDADFDLDGQLFSTDNFTLGIDSIFANVPGKTIVVKIPKTACLSAITVNTAGADVDINNVNTDNFTINSFSGNISAISLKASSMSIQNVSGSVDLDNIASDFLSVNNVSGNVDVNGDIEALTFEGVSGDLSYSTDSLRTSSISINTVSGDANITLPENGGFTVTNSRVSSEIKSEFKGRQLDEYYVYGDGSTEIDLNSVSGSITLKPLEYEKAEQETEQKKDEKKEASTSPTASTSQVQATTAKAAKSNS